MPSVEELRRRFITVSAPEPKKPIIEKSSSLTVKMVCPSCRNEIDLTACHCGEPETASVHAGGHVFVPMGCTCKYDSEGNAVPNDWTIKPKAAASTWTEGGKSTEVDDKRVPPGGFVLKVDKDNAVPNPSWIPGRDKAYIATVAVNATYSNKLDREFWGREPGWRKGKKTETGRAIPPNPLPLHEIVEFGATAPDGTKIRHYARLMGAGSTNLYFSPMVTRFGAVSPPRGDMAPPAKVESPKPTLSPDHIAALFASLGIVVINMSVEKGMARPTRMKLEFAMVNAEHEPLVYEVFKKLCGPGIAAKTTVAIEHEIE